jgi:hypothetical protein
MPGTSWSSGRISAPWRVVLGPAGDGHRGACGPLRMSMLARVPSALMMYTTPRRALLLPRVTFGAARPSRPFPSLLAGFEW